MPLNFSLHFFTRFLPKQTPTLEPCEKLWKTRSIFCWKKTVLFIFFLPEKHTFLQLKFQTFNFYKTKKSCPKNSWPNIRVPIYTYHTVSHKIKNPIPHFKSPNSTDSIGIGRVCILMGRIVFRMIPLFD